nr:plakophilin-2 isoform X1 [Nothobranchius furzeri]
MEKTRLLYTSLALPTEPRSWSRSRLTDPGFRVSQQVRLTMRQRQKSSSADGGVNSITFTTNSVDAADGSLSRSKTNKSALHSSSLTNYELKSSRSMAAPQKSLMDVFSTNSTVRRTTNTIAHGSETRGKGDSQKTLNQKSSQLSVNSTRVKRNLGNNPPKMTLEKAVHFLLNQNEEKLIAGASHIQHECFRDQCAKSTIQRLGGIEKLLPLLGNESENVQCAAAGALRNAVHRHNDNKWKVNECNGIEAILSALKSSCSKETIRHLTGLLWNLSAYEDLKEMFPEETASILTKTVLVPTSGIFKDDNPKHELNADTEAFCNALNCIQNLSSAGDNTRKVLRDCENLIDSLVYYIRRTVDDKNADDKSTGISVHILHNLTYEFEPELPKKITRCSSESQKNVASERTRVGCFPRRTAKVTKDPEEESPVLKEQTSPQGSEYLWSSITMRLYLSLLVCSQNVTTQLAAIGALHNATAGSGEMPKIVAATLKREKDTLKVIETFLQKKDENLMKAAISLTRNLSQHRVFQSTIVNKMLPEINNLLAERKEVVPLCQILINLCWNSTENSRAVLEEDILPKIIYTSKLENSYEEIKKASILLHIMWNHNELRKDFKAVSFPTHKTKRLKKSDFINKNTKRALEAVKEK